MGFVFKSAIGLGAVYFAMFGQALRSQDLGPAASLCANAADARLAGDPGLRAQWAAAGCAVAISAVTQRAVAPAPAAQPLPPRPAAAPPPPRLKAPSGTLSEADLAEPWFGPGRLTRKAGNRG